MNGHIWMLTLAFKSTEIIDTRTEKTLASRCIYHIGCGPVVSGKGVQKINKKKGKKIMVTSTILNLEYVMFRICNI